MLTAPSSDCIEYRFFSVGQGLFSAGRLSPAGMQPFAWVYDCGTASSPRLLASAIADFGHWHPGPLDLVALSHFDRDHVNGVCDLMRGRQVDVLLLPYVGFAERVFMALDAGIELDDPFLAFFIDPAAYFRNQGIDPTLILYVPPPGDASADPERNIGFGQLGQLVIREIGSLIYELGDAPPDSHDRPAAAAASGRVAWLRPGGAIRYRDLWEFVPYNDAVRQKRPLDLAKVEDFVRKRDEESLAGLRWTYDRAFGKSGRVRNAISLFLYAGPAARHRLATPAMRHLPNWQLVEGRRTDIWLAEHGATGWLATGDGYLNTKRRLDRLLAYLGADRTERVQVFQVMHHGAKPNWHAGLAAKIAPAVSIFSSDPDHRGFRHPHRLVWADFHGFGPCQVDRTTGFWIVGSLPA